MSSSGLPFTEWAFREPFLQLNCILGFHHPDFSHADSAGGRGGALDAQFLRSLIFVRLLEALIRSASGWNLCDAVNRQPWGAEFITEVR